MKAVIFDMDGTLYDTERIYGEAWERAGISHELYLRLIGRSHVSIVKLLNNCGYKGEEICALKKKYTDELLEKRGIPVKPGVIDTLKWLQERNILTAIATSSHISVADRYLDETNMRGYFSRVISGNGLEHGKPEPDIFLYAADQLEADPEDCVVVEDGFNGVRAGKAAGMTTVMIPDQVLPDEEMRSLADVILPSMEDLPEWLEKEMAVSSHSS